MKKSIQLAAAAAFLFSAGSAYAAPVDLTSWVSEGAGNWNVAAGNDSVVQTVNGQPTVFHNSTNSQGSALSGSIKVAGSDDDFIGFVLGYDAGDLVSATADYWLIDWKKGDQSGALDGLSLSHVTGTGPANDFWVHSGVVSEVLRATNLGSTGWITGTNYTFDLTFTSTLIEVFVNGVKELSYAGTFEDGGFGFYNYSQAGVEYAGITENPVSSVPLPAGLPILLSALGALGLASRRRKS